MQRLKAVEAAERASGLTSRSQPSGTLERRRSTITGSGARVDRNAPEGEPSGADGAVMGTAGGRETGTTGSAAGAISITSDEDDAARAAEGAGSNTPGTRAASAADKIPRERTVPPLAAI